MTTYDVCVVGLGPTGLTLAHLAARRGLSVLVLEREPEFYGMARAVYTDDECLRIFQAAGVADELHAQMNTGSVVQWVRADGSVLAQFHDSSEPHAWPQSNFLYQPFLEQSLEARLADHPSVTVRRGREVTGFTQDADGVSVEHVASQGLWRPTDTDAPVAPEPETARAAYLVGADGGRSVVRTRLGIEMDGRSFPQRWLVIDLRAKGGTDPFRHLPYFDFVCDPALPTVSCPQPDRRHRFEFMLHEGDDAADFESAGTARRLMARFIDVDDVHIERQLVYTFNALVAQRWRDGRVLLAGDAAHMTPQFIGQGMNAGIRDADNLSWKLAAVIRDGADASVLDTYETERKPHAKAMIDLSVFNKDVVSTQSPGAIRAREVGIGVGVKLPGVGRFLTEARMKPRPRFRRGRYLGMPRRRPRGVEGSLMPQPWVRTYEGRRVRLDDELGQGWVVLGIGCDPRTGVDPEVFERLSVRWASFHLPGTRPQRESAAPAGLMELEGFDASMARWLRRAGASEGSVVVLRPDKYVFSVTAPGEHHRAVSALTAQLGLAAVRA